MTIKQLCHHRKLYRKPKGGQFLLRVFLFGVCGRYEFEIASSCTTDHGAAPHHVFCNGRINTTLLTLYSANYQPVINFYGFPVFKLQAEVLMCSCIFCKNDKAACLSV